ncbi:MAG: DUF3592 domain-containing protein [Planctomycetaceae bacterium]
MNQLKRPLPHLLKALFVCVGVALAYWWITDGVSPLSFFILGGIVNYSAAAYFFQRARYRIRTWKTAKGKIVDMEDFADGPGGSPIVVFTDSHGRKYEFTNFMGGSNRYHVGSRVDVLYDPSRPENSQINDWPSLWAVTAIGIGTGTFFAILACLMA